MINLTKNALKFCHNGNIIILVAYDEDEEKLKVKVIDDGLGIKAEDMDKLFCMFGKLKRTAKSNSEGLGMGLMVCQNLVEKNNGSISAFSQGINKGSAFSFNMQMKEVKYTPRDS